MPLTEGSWRENRLRVRGKGRRPAARVPGLTLLRQECLSYPEVRKAASSRRTPQLGGGFGAAEEAAQAAEAFVDAFDGGGVGEAEIAGGAEGFAGDERYVSFVEKLGG